MDTDEYRALPGWVGCPHCEMPVNIRAQIEERTRDMARLFMDMLAERGIVEPELRARLEATARTAAEATTANMQPHPFLTLMPKA